MVGILVSLFSVVIINLIQSIPTTLDQELSNTTNPNESKIIKGKKMGWGEIGDDLKDMRCRTRHTDENCKDRKKQ